MVICKGRFPSTRMRFCSIELKADVLKKQIQLPLIKQGIDVVSWQGIRHDESKARSCAVERDLALRDEKTGAELWNYRPILDWTASDCFDMMLRHGIQPNPLYKLGMGRVGCMPCINCGSKNGKKSGKKLERNQLQRSFQLPTVTAKAFEMLSHGHEPVEADASTTYLPMASRPALCAQANTGFVNKGVNRIKPCT